MEEHRNLYISFNFLEKREELKIELCPKEKVLIATKLTSKQENPTLTKIIMRSNVKCRLNTKYKG